MDHPPVQPAANRRKRLLIADMKAFPGKKPVEKVELNRVTDGNIRGLPNRFQTNAQVLSAVIANDRLGRPDNYYATLPSRYRTIDATALDSAAKTWLQPDGLVYVVVGDRKVVEPQLKGIGLPIDPDTEMGCLSSQPQFDKTMSYIKLGQEEGARLLYGGNLNVLSSLRAVPKARPASISASSSAGWPPGIPNMQAWCWALTVSSPGGPTPGAVMKRRSASSIRRPFGSMPGRSANWRSPRLTCWARWFSRLPGCLPALP